VPFAVVPPLGTIPGFCQPVSSLSHLAAALVALGGTLSLLRLARGNSARTVALAVYAFCVIMVLAVSGTYHSLAEGGSPRAIMQRLDHYAIWLLIAGTFTAVHGVMHEGVWRRRLLSFVWSYAALGIAAQMVWFPIFSGPLGLALYLGLGWVGIVSVVKLGREIGFAAVRPLWYAGVVYSAGAIFEALREPVLVRNWVGPHEIFHFAVVMGVALHWTFIRRLLRHHVPVLVPVPFPAPVPVPVLIPAHKRTLGP